MTKAQERFCNEYLKDLNATKAYKVAYPSCKKDTTANVNSSKLLRNTKVQEYLSERMKELEEQTQITQKDIIEELSKIAFFNIKNIYNENGSLKSVTDLKDDVSRAISSVKVTQKAGSMAIGVSGDGKENDVSIEHIPERTIEIKSNDKIKALELLGKHLGMFKEKIEISKSTEDTIKEIEEYVNGRTGANET